MLNIKRLLNTELGRFFISVIIGLGLATLFRKSCTDKNCIVFDGPVISEVDGKTFKFGEMCYKYELRPSKCDPTKRTIEITHSSSDKEDGGGIPKILKPQAPVDMSKPWF